MVVYIEYAIIDNMVIDFLILKTLFSIMRKPYKKRNLLFASIFGTAFAVFLPLIDFNGFLTVILKIACGTNMILISNSYKSVKEFIRYLTVFLIITFALGGGITFIYNLFNIKNSEFSIGIVLLPAYLLTVLVESVVKGIKVKTENKNLYFSCNILISNKKIPCVGFLDTGNNLSIDGFPVLVCEKRLFNKLLKSEIDVKSLKKAKCQTVTGEKEILVFKIDGIEIINNGKSNIYNNVMIGLSKKGIGGYKDLLLNSMLKEIVYDDIDAKTKEAC